MGASPNLRCCVQPIVRDTSQQHPPIFVHRSHVVWSTSRSRIAYVTQPGLRDPAAEISVRPVGRRRTAAAGTSSRRLRLGAVAIPSPCDDVNGWSWWWPERGAPMAQRAGLTACSASTNRASTCAPGTTQRSRRSCISLPLRHDGQHIVPSEDRRGWTMRPVRPGWARLARSTRGQHTRKLAWHKAEKRTMPAVRAA